MQWEQFKLITIFLNVYLTYKGSDNELQTSNDSELLSMERFITILLEHTGIYIWLMPTNKI
jgi:hypothetical protein